MIKFKVKVSHIFSELLDIEANDETEVKKIVEQNIFKKGRQINPIYEATFPPEQWTILTEEQFQAMVEEAKAKKEKENIQNL